jgi:integrase
VREVRVSVGKTQRTRDFPITVPAELWKQWQEDKRRELRREAPSKAGRGTFTALGESYLSSLPQSQRKHDTARIRHWCESAGFGALAPSAITRQQIDHWLALWQVKRPATLMMRRSRDDNGRIVQSCEQLVAMAHPHNGKGWTASTLNKMLTALGNALHSAGIPDVQNPAKQIERFTEPKHNSRWFSDELLDFILTTIRGEQSRAIIDVLVCFGLRHSELKRLTQTDIDWTGARNGGRPTVMIRRPPGAKLGKPRQLAWDERGGRALRRFVDLGLLGKDFSNSSLWKAWQRAVRKAREAGHEIPNGHMRPYDCRHKRLTEIYEATGDIHVTSEVAGHTRVQTTMDNYAPVNTHMIASAVDKVAARRVLPLKRSGSDG